ncbi:MAG: KamA family protein [Gemmatimonadota bacterium]|nr:MAG: KamA family protein [Gemmatimonadota bacterium]
MDPIEELDHIAINVRSHRLVKTLLKENPKLEQILRNSKNETEARVGVREWVLDELQQRPQALAYYEGRHADREAFEALSWSDYAAIRLLDYVDHAGRQFEDLNLRGAVAVSTPIRQLWLAVNHGTGGAKPDFFEDALHLFRQFSGRSERRVPTREEVESWMDRYPSGLDPRIVALREENRERILNIIIDRMDRGEISSQKFRFEGGLSRVEKFKQALEWWNDMQFHLQFAVRSPQLLNQMLGDSLDPDTMSVLYRARDAGIPFFVNPYYLSLLHVRVPYFAIGADLAMRHYVVYSEQLVEEFGHIRAWEREDEVVPGKPNAAGWCLPPYDNVHRRYPDVAILIPDTTGRACGGLCSACQRMYDFQRGGLNFNLEELEPKPTWPQKLSELMRYFEEDSQLRDILITGGDALMSTDKAMQRILDAVYSMVRAKCEANANREQKYAEIQRVRLGTRLPVYLPQRITPQLTEILARFREQALEVGVKQFVIQTHIESPMEVTPEARDAVQQLLSAGWVVTNQLVSTTAASRRGHTAKLRQVLNEIGILPYYTFVVKGYRENSFNYAPVARLAQEEMEEKVIGRIPERYHESVRRLSQQAESVVHEVSTLRGKVCVPFLATDRNVLNLPAVGKSLTFRVIGITRYGRRILEFDHDRTRACSPIIDQIGKVIVIESKSLREYLRQLEELGEEISEYGSCYGYSMGQTEPRIPLFEYPEYDYVPTTEITNFELPDSDQPLAGAEPVSGPAMEQVH